MRQFAFFLMSLVFAFSFVSCKEDEKEILNQELNMLIDNIPERQNIFEPVNVNVHLSHTDQLSSIKLYKGDSVIMMSHGNDFTGGTYQLHYTPVLEDNNQNVEFAIEAMLMSGFLEKQYFQIQFSSIPTRLITDTVRLEIQSNKPISLSFGTNGLIIEDFPSEFQINTRILNIPQTAHPFFYAYTDLFSEYLTVYHRSSFPNFYDIADPKSFFNNYTKNFSNEYNSQFNYYNQKISFFNLSKTPYDIASNVVKFQTDQGAKGFVLILKNRLNPNSSLDEATGEFSFVAKYILAE
ncbi:hypothetical protein [Aureibacter tunicatorum]|uniref:Uncharacterized protein n=1 Tax=Aureibacter tunicatorum TaxID=866807 RepID=A0AAE3XSY7_9BACT|nr:hypothetical protein [Aureibacter tunicatorum]MDR6241440.1 hypothetical protein [Aureibacter tunicatorum]BDD06715.1 hypothetical protein AUTU_41980 [Aureibacter tunicatorum]